MKERRPLPVQKFLCLKDYEVSNFEFYKEGEVYEGNKYNNGTIAVAGERGYPIFFLGKQPKDVFQLQEGGN